MTMKPWKMTAYLMIYNQHLRRLDVHGSHTNRTDGEAWRSRTHKHTFSERHRDSVAYTPGDIPETPLTDVGPEHYRGVFEAFCGEQNIRLTGEYGWVDPVLPT